MGQTQPHIPLLHPHPRCFLSKLMAFMFPLAGSSRDLPRCMEMCPTIQWGDHCSSGAAPPYPIPPITSLQHSEGNGFGCRTPSLPEKLEPSRYLAPLQKSPIQIAGLHASAAAATARLKRKSEKKSCIISAR